MLCIYPQVYKQFMHWDCLLKREDLYVTVNFCYTYQEQEVGP
jgi:hypothetical protein